MPRVAIIGAGDIGATTALTLARRECAGSITLIDGSGAIAAGKALDILQSGPISGVDVHVSGATDVTAAAGAAVVVIADRAGADGEWRATPASTWCAGSSRSLQRRRSCSRARTLQYSLALAHRELRADRRRFVGSAPGALVSAARAMAAVGAGCSADDVALAVVGVPGSWILAWTECTVSRCSHHRLDARTPAGADRAAHAGELAARPVCARLGCCAPGCGNSRELAPPLHGIRRAGRRGPDARRVVAAVPATLGLSGIRALHPPDLSTRERVMLDTALSRG